MLVVIVFVDMSPACAKVNVPIVDICLAVGFGGSENSFSSWGFVQSCKSSTSTTMNARNETLHHLNVWIDSWIASMVMVFCFFIPVIIYLIIVRPPWRRRKKSRRKRTLNDVERISQNKTFKEQKMGQNIEGRWRINILVSPLLWFVVVVVVVVVATCVLSGFPVTSLDNDTSPEIQLGEKTDHMNAPISLGTSENFDHFSLISTILNLGTHHPKRKRYFVFGDLRLHPFPKGLLASTVVLMISHE